MHVSLVGPCSPIDVAELLCEADAICARETPGYRGIPVSELAKGLVAAGHQVTVVSTDASISCGHIEFSGPQFRMVVQRSRARPRVYLRDLYAVERREMAAILRDVAPDLVHAHWTYEFELAAQYSGLPHVTTAHDAPLTILRRMRDPYRAARLGVAARARPGIRHLSAVSPYLADRWRKEMHYRRPIRIVPNSIPTDASPPHRTPANHPVALEVADAGERKNVRRLLQAFKMVRSHVPAAELRLVGPGLGADESMALWAHLQGLSTGVTFLGRLRRDELSAEYRRAWSFVHASLEESFGLVLLEAMAAGLPTIGGRHSGGVPFVLDDGHAGVLTDVSDPRALADAIVDSLARGPEVMFPAPNVKRFSPKTVAAQYLDWYRAALNGGEAVVE